MSKSLPTFGTAGIRARLGPGIDEINAALVARCAVALAEHALDTIVGAEQRGMCIAFDGRHSSREFAHHAARAACAAGIHVHVFERPQPTPVLAFACRHLGAACAMIITASHNPPQDNGIKVYWQGGAQIVPPHDAQVARRMAAIDPDQLPLADEQASRAEGRWHPLGEAEEQAYCAAVRAQSLYPQLPRPVSLAYTAMHGVGSPLAHRLIEGPMVQFHEVTSQAEPDPDFGGLASPNPEHPRAVEQVLALADERACDLALANDPDADRLAVACRDEDGRMRVLTGDEVGALLGDFLLEHDEQQPPPLFVSTVVSGGMLAALCEARGVRHETTLTGFRWIASRARELEASEGLSFRFGYEEAIGYALGALGDDKDGLCTARLMVEMASVAALRNSSLLGRLHGIYEQVGVYRTTQRSWTLAGDSGRASIQRAMDTLRDDPPATLLGEPASYTDWLQRPERADLMVVQTAHGTRAAMRPSGTEPKLKLYLQVHESRREDETWARVEGRADARLGALAEEVSSRLALES